MSDATRLIFTPMPHSAGRYTNLQYLFTAPFYRMFGLTLNSARISNLIPLVILGVSLYFLGLKLGGKNAALLAVLFALFNPLVFESSRQYGIDLMLSAFTSLSITILIYNKGFKSRRALVWALITGIGVFFKPHIALFVGPAAVSYLLINIRIREDKKNILINASLSALTVSLFFLFWIVNNFSSIVWDATGIRQTEYLPYFFRNFLLTVSGLPALIFFIPGVRRIIKENKEYGYPMLFAILIPLIFLSYLFSFKWHTDRFFLPAAPLIGAVAAVGMVSIKRKLQIPIIIVTITYFIAQFSLLTFSVSTDILDFDDYDYEVYFREQKSGFLNPSSYGVVYSRGDVSGLGEVIELIDERIIGEEPVYIIGLSKTLCGPKPFEVRYRFRLRSSKYEYLDYAQMAHSVHSAYKYENPEFIIIKQTPDLSVGILYEFEPFSEIIKESLHLSNRLFYEIRVSEEIQREKYEGLMRQMCSSRLIGTVEREEILWRVYETSGGG